MKANNRCLYLNAPPMVAGMRSCLAAAGLDLAAEIGRGALVLSSDEAHPVDRRFDAGRLLAMLQDAVEHALRDGFRGLWTAGDMTWEFGPEKNFSKLREYEEGLEELLGRRPEIQGICQYHVDTLPDQTVQEALYAHRACYINETLSRLNPSYVPAGSEPRTAIPRDEQERMAARAITGLGDLPSS